MHPSDALQAAKRQSVLASSSNICLCLQHVRITANELVGVWGLAAAKKEQPQSLKLCTIQPQLSHLGAAVTVYCAAHS